jgi:hypothetical protein
VRWHFGLSGRELLTAGSPFFIMIFKKILLPFRKYLALPGILKAEKRNEV